MEVEKFKQALRKMFASRGPSVLVYIVYILLMGEMRDQPSGRIHVQMHMHTCIYTPPIPNHAQARASYFSRPSRASATAGSTPLWSASRSRAPPPWTRPCTSSR